MTDFTKPTREETYKKIFAAIKADKVMPLTSDCHSWDASCSYEYQSGRRCIVGCLFTSDQIESIKAFGKLDAGIYPLAATIGKDNIEFVTGLSITELSDLQDAHDTLIDDVIYNVPRHDILKQLVKEVKQIKKEYDDGAAIC